MAKILYEPGDIVLVEGSKPAIVLPNDKVLYVEKRGGQHLIDIKSGTDNIEIIRVSEVSNIEYERKVAFRAVIAAMEINISDELAKALIS